MTVEITYEPEAPAAGDALTFTVTGEVEDTARVTITADGDELQSSTEFGQGVAPEGTGQDAMTLDVHGGTGGTFTLTVLTPDGEEHETDPIYYHNDAPTYAYPDTDDVVEALEAAVDGLSVEASKDGAVMTLLLGGDYSGKDLTLTIDAAAITGSETTAIVETGDVGGPFVWGPIVLGADVYTVDVVYASGDDEGDSALDAPVEITIS